MIHGIGVDIIEVERVAGVVQRYGDHFLQRIFTRSELDDCGPGEHQYRRLAARFAAKEATLKALGMGLRGVRWADMSVVKDTLGKPSMQLHGRLAEVAGELGVTQLHLSMSHCKEYAMAQVVAVR